SPMCRCLVGDPCEECEARKLSGLGAMSALPFCCPYGTSVADVVGADSACAALAANAEQDECQCTLDESGRVGASVDPLGSTVRRSLQHRGGGARVGVAEPPQRADDEVDEHPVGRPDPLAGLPVEFENGQSQQPSVAGLRDQLQLP